MDSAATEAALDRLLANGVVRDIPRAEGVEMKHLTTRWERGWRKRAAGWEYKVRFVGSEYKWQEFREDPCCGSFLLHWTHCKHPLMPSIRHLSWKTWWQKPTEECLRRLRTAGKCTDSWWKLEHQLPGRRPAGHCWVDRTSAPQFFWIAERQVGMEVHIDDLRGFGQDQQVEKFKKDLAVHIRFRDGGIPHNGSEYDHLKRIRKKFDGVPTIEGNPKCLDAVLELLGLETVKDVPTPSVPAHKQQVVTGDLLGPAEVTVYRQCVGGTALLHGTTERMRSLRCRFLGLGKPTTGSMMALKRVARYLKDT